MEFKICHLFHVMEVFSWKFLFFMKSLIYSYRDGISYIRIMAISLFIGIIKVSFWKSITFQGISFVIEASYFNSAWKYIFTFYIEYRMVISFKILFQRSFQTLDWMMVCDILYDILDQISSSLDFLLQWYFEYFFFFLSCL